MWTRHQSKRYFFRASAAASVGIRRPGLVSASTRRAAPSSDNSGIASCSGTGLAVSYNTRIRCVAGQIGCNFQDFGHDQSSLRRYACEMFNGSPLE